MPGCASSKSNAIQPTSGAVDSDPRSKKDKKHNATDDDEEEEDEEYSESEEEEEEEEESDEEDDEEDEAPKKKKGGNVELVLTKPPKDGFSPVEGIPTELQDDFPDFPFDPEAMRVDPSCKPQDVSGRGVYTGPWENSQMHGIGQLEDAGGNKFIGQFNRNKMEGLVYAEMRGSRGVTKYWGEYYQQKPHGYGRMQLPDGSVIIGNFNQGKRQGRCKEIRNNGAVVISNFNGDEIEGMGLYRHSNGELYIGQFKKSQYHGIGTFWWPDGRCYQGHFENGQQSPKGTQWWADGQVYKGDFKNNQPNGGGILKLPQGNVEINGLFVKGCVEGTCHVLTLQPDGNWYTRDAKYVLGKRQRWLGNDKPSAHTPIEDTPPPNPLNQ